MDALTEKAGTEGDFFARVRTAHRRFPWLLVAAILVIGSATGAGLFLANYQPLVRGNSGGVQPPASTIHRDGQSIKGIRYRQGAEARIAFDIENAGPVGVTVTGVDPGSDGLPIRLVAVGLGSTDTGIPSWVGEPPFRPFSLPAGGHRVLIVVYRFVDCSGLGSNNTVGFDRETISFRVFGVNRRAVVPLLDPFEVLAPSTCPAKTSA